MSGRGCRALHFVGVAVAPNGHVADWAPWRPSASTAATLEIPGRGGRLLSSAPRGRLGSAHAPPPGEGHGTGPRCNNHRHRLRWGGVLFSRAFRHRAVWFCGPVRRAIAALYAIPRSDRPSPARQWRASRGVRSPEGPSGRSGPPTQLGGATEMPKPESRLS